VTAAAPTRADWGSAPLPLRRKPHRASTVESPQVQYQNLRLPTESAAAQISGEDPRQFGASINSFGALLMRQQPLTAILQHVAASAAAAILGADGAGLALLDDGRADTIVASEPFVVAIDQVQYRLGQGPCLSAVARSGTWTCGGG
jgi:putative methionine-R-sulfoxide reductase with GAF domain